LLTTHASRYNRAYGLKGHVWQGRFHAFPIEQDDHLLTVLRYVERNPLRANLVGRGGGLAVVEPRRAAGTAAGAVLASGPRAIACGLGDARQRAADGGGTGAGAASGAAWLPVRLGGVGEGRRDVPGIGEHATAPRPAADSRKTGSAW